MSERECDECIIGKLVEKKAVKMSEKIEWIVR